MQIRWVIILPQSDLKPNLFRMVADAVLYWEEFGSTWGCVWRQGQGRLWVKTGPVPQTFTLDETTQIYIRYPAEERGWISSVYLLLRLLGPASFIGISPGISDLNKPAQLFRFGTMAPNTRITNRGRVLQKRPQWIVKSLSYVRSRTTTIHALAHRIKSRLDCPVQLQSRLRGTEVKLHVLYKSNYRLILAVAIQTHALDYRHEREKVHYRRVEHIPQALLAVADSIRRTTGSTFFDIDYLIKKNGDIKILEWNNSPVPHYFENFLNPDLPFTQKVFASIAPVVISLRGDRNVKLLRKASAGEGSKPLFLAYEDLGQQWTYRLQNGVLSFRYKEQLLFPSAIYFRVISDSQRRGDIFTLLHAMELFPGPVLGKPYVHFYNGSKMLQTIHSLVFSSVRLPAAYILKGCAPSHLREIVDGHPMVIVKSLSGRRSHVVDQKEFGRWDLTPLRWLPTLFQEGIEGTDLRVHYLRGEVWGKAVTKKMAVDYRYAESAPFREAKIPVPIRRYCQTVARKEGNDFLGFDFIRKGRTYYCLEANPGPGWFTYHHQDQTSHGLAQGLRKYLSP